MNYKELIALHIVMVGLGLALCVLAVRVEARAMRAQHEVEAMRGYIESLHRTKHGWISAAYTCKRVQP